MLHYYPSGLYKWRNIGKIIQQFREFKSEQPAVDQMQVEEYTLKWKILASSYFHGISR